MELQSYLKIPSFLIFGQKKTNAKEVISFGFEENLTLKFQI